MFDCCKSVGWPGFLFFILFKETIVAVVVIDELDLRCVAFELGSVDGSSKLLVNCVRIPGGTYLRCVM